MDSAQPAQNAGGRCSPYFCLQYDTSGDQKECTGWRPCTNRKRPRATYEQLSVLERTFQVNALPNAKVREALSRQLHMKPRSIRIWFQNRRAKEKLSKRKAIEKLADCVREEQHPGCFGYVSAELEGPAVPQPYAPQYTHQCQPAFPTSDVYAPCFLRKPSEPCTPLCITTPLHFLAIGPWRESSSESRAISLTFDTANRTIEIDIASHDVLYKVASRVTSVFSIHFTRLHQSSGQITIKLSSPSEIYTYPESPAFPHQWGLPVDFLASADSLEQIVYGDYTALRASLLELAKRDSHVRAITFMKIESPEVIELPGFPVPPPALQIPEQSPQDKAQFQVIEPRSQNVLVK